MPSVRSQLHAQVVTLSGGYCEHPNCGRPMAEMAHIKPRGMGHTGYRDTLGNVMAACTVHARSTDDLSSPEWEHVPGGDRIGLAAYVAERRRLQGFDVS